MKSYKFVKSEKTLAEFLLQLLVGGAAERQASSDEVVGRCTQVLGLAELWCIDFAVCSVPCLGLSWAMRLLLPCSRSVCTQFH